MQTFPQEGPELERGGIPVDKSQFSTFSTGFSTGVFHRGSSVWIFIFGSHKKTRHTSPNFLLFCRLWFLPQGSICTKNRVLTEGCCGKTFMVQFGSPQPETSCSKWESMGEIGLFAVQTDGESRGGQTLGKAAYSSEKRMISPEKGC